MSIAHLCQYSEKKHLSSSSRLPVCTVLPLLFLLLLLYG